MRPIFDAHLDLSWSALQWNRDLTLPLADVRAAEAHMTDHRARGRLTVTLPEMRRGGVGACLGTLLSRAKPHATPAAGFNRRDLDFRNQSLASAMAHGQLAYYKLLEAQGHIRILQTGDDLRRHWQAWSAVASSASSTSSPSAASPPTASQPTASQLTASQHTASPPTASQPTASQLTASRPAALIGVIIAMEGADPIVTPSQAQDWFAAGLRCVGLAHYGQSAYAFGTGGEGPLTTAGRELLRELRRLGMIVDLTHCAEPGFFEVLDLFDGPVHASHNMCRALTPGDRQFSDDQIRRLIERGAVIGMALDAWMLHAGWVAGQTARDLVSLEIVADHIDHICQLAGNTRHVGIGSDLDGGFGAEQIPRELDSIADLQKLDALLCSRGYGDADLNAIFHANWLRFFTESLPK